MMQNMWIGQNPVSLVKIKIAGIYEAHPPKSGIYRFWLPYEAQ